MKRKLIRDKIKEEIQLQGKNKLITKVLTNEERVDPLTETLFEEALEYKDAANLNEKTEELADILEVVYASASAIGITEEQLNHARNRKLENKGGFTEGFILNF